MGRSVSRPSNATAVAYRSFEAEDEFDAEFEFEYLIDWVRETAKEAWPSMIDWVRETAKEAWPSMVECDEWVGREDHAILSNDLAYIGLSEYCGLVSIWLVDREDRYDGYDQGESNLCKPWCAQIERKFLKLFSEYQKIGTASNGESFYERVEA
jgi:hypothetical protein